VGRRGPVGSLAVRRPSKPLNQPANNENRLKISNPQRVLRILRRICQASLQVMVRSVGASGVAVKGRAATVIVDISAPALRISNISDKGIQHLNGMQRIQVEFVMMSTKVVFVANILSREQNSLLVSLPTSLISIERRKNARYPCTEDLTAYLDLSIWKPAAEDPTSPPFYPHYADVGGFIALSDVSFGGLCAVTRFPAVNTVLRRGLIDDRAKLVLPMQAPLDVAVEIRWFKRIKEHVKADESESFMRSYRFGIEFISQTEEVRVAVRQFIQQLAQAGAI
jgi:hypothetical protein